MAASIKDPPAGVLGPVCVNQPIYLEADPGGVAVADLLWKVRINSAAESQIALGVVSLVYTTPSSVTNADPSGNKGVDQIMFNLYDNSSGVLQDTRTMLMTQGGVPKFSATRVLGGR